MIIIIDFGSQSTHLISRRFREIAIDTKIVVPEEFFDVAQSIQYEGIVLSGGPSSVYEEGAPTIDKRLFELGKPVLGICYGEQVMAHVMGGKVSPGAKKEYGPAILTIHRPCALFEGVFNAELRAPSSELKTLPVWMSHGDEVLEAPIGFETVGTTETIPHAAIADENRKMYGIQFHPEVVHTPAGTKILENFAKICGLSPKDTPITKEFVDELIEEIKIKVGDKKIIGAFSGGVDSSIASLLVHRAVGSQFTAFYIDSGLMRDGETDELKRVFKDHFHMNVEIIDAKEQFLNALKGIADPETKRKIIGKTFIEVFDIEAKKLDATFLVQGTIYPDVIESAGTKHSQNIKSHHNVGGLPADMKLTLLEPIRNFYKDEVRQIGAILELPREVTHRHPFPGPGLAIRIIGDVTEEKLSVLRAADRIVRDEVMNAGLGDTLWQMFAVHTGIRTTGVRGDSRAYGETIAIRAVESKDVMSVKFAHLPFELLEKISIRIVTEVPNVNRVLYDITNKPPGTIEWE